MNAFQVVILGIVQGLTEFLPISSSAHLVLVPYFLRWEYPPVALDAALHFGTFLAIFVYFFPEILKIFKGFFASFNPQGNASGEVKFYSRLFWWIVIGSIPAVVAALLFQDQIEGTFQSATITAVFLLFTGVLLAFTDTFSNPSKPLPSLNNLKALIIGLFQALALFPGVSRSGATISGGITLGLKKEEAARFSFLLSLPVVLGATIFQIPSLRWEDINIGNFFMGILVSGVVGILSIHFFLKLVKRTRLIWFAVYCWLFGIFSLLKIFVF